MAFASSLLAINGLKGGRYFAKLTGGATGQEYSAASYFYTFLFCGGENKVLYYLDRYIMETDGYYVGAVKNPRFANSELRIAYEKEVKLMNYKNKQ